MNQDLGKRPWDSEWPVRVPKTIEIPHQGLGDMLRETARRLPDHKAIVFLDSVMNYRTLDDFADRCATSLNNLGLEKGDVVALMLPNCHQFAVAYFACARLGLIVTAINPLYKPLEVKHQLNDSAAKALIALDAIWESPGKIIGETKVKHIIQTNIVDLAGFGLIKRFIGKKLGKIPTGQLPARAIPFTKLLNVVPNVPQVAINPAEDIAVLQYTGGTTGTPKGAMLTHANLVSNTIAGRAWIGRSGDGVGWVGVLPLFHIYAMTCVMNASVSSGGFQLLFPKPPENMLELARQIEKWGRGTELIMPGVAALYNKMNNTPGIEKFDLTCITRGLSGAGPLPREIAETFQKKTKAIIVEGYGLTESAPVAFANPFELNPGQEPVIGSIGLPFPSTDVKIVDVQTGEKRMGFGPDQVGELCIKGPQVMKGYHNNPEESARALRGGWLYTGDIAYMNERGWTFIMDRAKDMIKYKGYSVFPKEVEDYMFGHPAIRDVAVIGVPGQETGEMVKAFVVLDPNARGKVKSEEIIDWCRANMSHYKVPKEVEFMDELPKSTVGKVLKRVLREEELRKRSRSK